MLHVPRQAPAQPLVAIQQCDQLWLVPFNVTPEGTRHRQPQLDLLWRPKAVLSGHNHEDG